MGIATSLVTLLIAGGCLANVFYFKTYRAMTWSGMVLAVYGLLANTISAIFIASIFPDSSQEVLIDQKELLSNSFLILSAIGANLFAAAICSKVREKNDPIKAGQKYAIQLTHLD